MTEVERNGGPRCAICGVAQQEHPDGVHLNAGPVWVCSDCLPDGDLPSGTEDEILAEIHARRASARIAADIDEMIVSEPVSEEERAAAEEAGERKRWRPEPGRRFIVKVVKGQAARTISTPQGEKKENRLAMFIHNHDRSFEHIEVEWKAVSAMLKAMGPAREVHVWASLNAEGVLRLHGPARPQDW